MSQSWDNLASMHDHLYMPTKHRDPPDQDGWYQQLHNHRCICRYYNTYLNSISRSVSSKEAQN